MSDLSVEQQHALRKEFTFRLGDVITELSPKMATPEHVAILAFSLLEMAHLVALSSLDVTAGHSECEAGWAWAMEAMTAVMKSASRTASAT